MLFPIGAERGGVYINSCCEELEYRVILAVFSMCVRIMLYNGILNHVIWDGLTLHLA